MVAPALPLESPSAAREVVASRVQEWRAATLEKGNNGRPVPPDLPVSPMLDGCSVCARWETIMFGGKCSLHA